jgi:hypothetical protein
MKRRYKRPRRYLQQLYFELRPHERHGHIWYDVHQCQPDFSDPIPERREDLSPLCGRASAIATLTSEYPSCRIRFGVEGGAA